MILMRYSAPDRRGRGRKIGKYVKIGCFFTKVGVTVFRSITMTLKELNELAENENAYLFFSIDGVKYEIDNLIDSDEMQILLSGYEQ